MMCRMRNEKKKIKKKKRKKSYTTTMFFAIFIYHVKYILKASFTLFIVPLNNLITL